MASTLVVQLVLTLLVMSFGLGLVCCVGILLIGLMRFLRVYRMLDLTASGAGGHGPIHSAAQIGFAWDGAEQGWLRVSLLCLLFGCLPAQFGPIQQFRSAILQAWHLKVTAGLAEREGFREVQFADIKGSLQLLILRAILSCGGWNGFLLGRAKKEDVPFWFCGGRDGDGNFFGSVRFPLCNKFGICLNLLPSYSEIGAGGPGVYYGMAGCLGLVMTVNVIAGLRLLVSLPRGGWNLHLVLTLLIGDG